MIPKEITLRKHRRMGRCLVIAQISVTIDCGKIRNNSRVINMSSLFNCFKKSKNLSFIISIFFS